MADTEHMPRIRPVNSRTSYSGQPRADQARYSEPPRPQATPACSEPGCVFDVGHAGDHRARNGQLIRDPIERAIGVRADQIGDARAPLRVNPRTIPPTETRPTDLDDSALRFALVGEEIEGA